MHLDYRSVGVAFGLAFVLHVSPLGWPFSFLGAVLGGAMACRRPAASGAAGVVLDWVLIAGLQVAVNGPAPFFVHMAGVLGEGTLNAVVSVVVMFTCVTALGVMGGFFGAQVMEVVRDGRQSRKAEEAAPVEVVEPMEIPQKPLATRPPDAAATAWRRPFRLGEGVARREEPAGEPFVAAAAEERAPLRPPRAR